MGTMDKVRAALDQFVDALQAKIPADAGPNVPVAITVGDVKQVIEALQQAKAEMPTSLPFGL